MKRNNVTKIWDIKGERYLILTGSQLFAVCRYNLCNVFCALVSRTTRNAIAEVGYHGNITQTIHSIIG